MPSAPYTSAKFALSINNDNSGWLYSAEGGMASTDVVTEKLGQEHLVRKRIGNLKYEDITLSFGAGMSRQFYDWIKASFENKHERRDGAILTCDYDATVKSTLDFYRALISEITFPALDAASKDAAKMTVKMTPEMTKVKYGGGGSVTPQKYPISSQKQKKWSPANFRLRIDGLEDACRRVNKIEALTLKQKVLEVPVGELRDYEREPAHLEVPNLVVTLTESFSEPFHKWFEDFVIRGNCDEGNQKTGSLECLTPDLKDTLFTLNFEALGIFKMTPDKHEAGSENLRRVKFEMYTERLTFDFSNDAVFS
jgi:phage tail-like protein